jgi:hypothetical protein
VNFLPNDKIWFEASLLHNKVDCGKVATVRNKTVSFNANLIWSTDRKNIQSMKQANNSIRIDFYEVKQGEERQLIGNVLVPFRTISILAVNKAVQLQKRWFKMIGLERRYKEHKPEIYMSALVTYRDYLEHNEESHLNFQPISKSDSIVLEEDPMISSQNGIFIRLLRQEGLLQVGDIDTNIDLFNLKITLKYIKNLSLVSPNLFYQIKTFK